MKKILEKLKIKILAPSTLCYLIMGSSSCELKFWSFAIAKFMLPGELVGEDGYYKSVYINNKRVKPWSIIPRHALIEVRNKPKEPISLLGATILLSLGATVTTAAAFATAVGWLVVGVAAAAVVGGTLALSGAFSAKGSSNGTSPPKYSANDSPSLSGAKNELLEGVVPVSFGRSLQVFPYAQYTTPLVNSGYGGNRYRVYCIPGYANARYEDFRLGDVLLSNYRSTAYSLQQSNGGSAFIGWDNAVTETFNKELTFDTEQAVFQSAIAYYNQSVSGTSVLITQSYNLQGVVLASWTNKVIDVVSTFVSSSADVSIESQITILSSDLVSDGSGGYNATKTTNVDLSAYSISEYRYTTTRPFSTTRGNDGESALEITLMSESIEIDGDTYSDTVEQGVNSYIGDKNELISQSPTRSMFCDMHFSFPQGLFSVNASTGERVSVTIQAEVYWKRKGDSSWSGLDSTDISQIYTRDVDGVVQTLSSRITRSGNVLTFKSPDDMNYAKDKFFECVGLSFAEEGQYLVKVLPVVFTRDSFWTGSIYLADVIWRLNPTIDVVDPSMLPHVTQIACTFNATTQLTGEVDALGAICRPYIKNISTGLLEQSRNPVDIIYYLLTDEDSNPDPMTEDQIDMDSFLEAREWCDEHNCLTDGVEGGEARYEMVINEICSNNQLYLIPNKWGKTVLRVDTNEDGRPIKTFFNAENSWDLQVTRQRGSLSRLLALRCSYINEDTWGEQEITGYWYNDTCNWVPESGKDDTYYKPEKRDLKYIKNEDAVKRRIAYELEIANVKNVTATLSIAREVLDLEVLDRVLVADYTRIDDGLCGTINDVIKNETGDIIGVSLDAPLVVTDGMTITIRSIDISGEGQNVEIYSLSTSTSKTSNIYFTAPISAASNIIRGVGFYDMDGQEFYHSGDIYMVGTSELLSMVISKIEEVSGDDFTSKITCRLF